MKRAAIYTRVSTEEQGKKASPQEQENDCRALAESKVYEVVEVYRDIGSGTSTKHRPAFLQMLKDAESGKFDVLLAWREDRLYRGYLDTGFIDLMRLVEPKKITIELAKDHFNQTMAVIKAAMAAEENRARVARTHMGVKAGLKAGNTWGTGQILGYTKKYTEDGRRYVVVDPSEAETVAMIWDWYDQGVGVREISRRLIKKQVPQKRREKVDALSWKVGSIYKILKNPVYATGKHVVRRDGETFEIPLPAIRELDQYQRIQARLKKNRNNKARNTKHNYLVQGLVTSPCGGRWGAYTRMMKKKWHKKSTGEDIPYRTKYAYYFCRRKTQNASKNAHEEGCPVSRSVRQIDQYVWQQVSEIIRNPKLITDAANAEIQRLRETHQEADREIKRLYGILKDLKRQKEAHIDHFGSMAASGVFTKADLERALLRVRDQEEKAYHKLDQLQVVANTAQGDIDELANKYLAAVSSGIDWLDEDLEDPEKKQLQFEERKRIVKSLVDHVILTEGKNPEIKYKIPLDRFIHSNQQLAEGGNWNERYLLIQIPAGVEK